MAQSFGMTLQDADKQYRNFAVKDRLSAGTVVANTIIAETSDIVSEVVDDLTVVNTLTLSAFTENSIPYIGADGLVSEDTNFTWTDSTNNLKLGASGVSIGPSAGYATQSVAIGSGAGQTSQATQAVAIGWKAGGATQSTTAVAIGVSAGQTVQGAASVAVGLSAGAATQGAGAIAIGSSAGASAQGAGAVAIGISAGAASQGANAIAIGNLAGQTSQFAGSICLNASGTAVAPTQAGFYVSTVRTQAIAANTLTLGVLNGEICINSSKTFVIDHPLKPETHYLVHACLEGPEAGVYYRGQVTIPAGEVSVTVSLPDYAVKLIKDATVQLTAIDHFEAVAVSPVDAATGKFAVKLKGVHPVDTQFYWHVTGKREDVAVEVAKDGVQKLGSGPYTYLG